MESLQRTRSDPLPNIYNFCMLNNDVYLPTKKSLKYIDILPPPSMLYYNDMVHRVFTDTNMQRYIKYKGKKIYLTTIVGQYSSNR